MLASAALSITWTLDWKGVFVAHTPVPSSTLQVRNLQPRETKQHRNLQIPRWENYPSWVCLSAETLGHLLLEPDVCRTVKKKVMPEVSCWRAWLLAGIYTSVQGQFKSLFPSVPPLASPCSDYRDTHLPWARPALCCYSTCHGASVPVQSDLYSDAR